MSKVVEIIMMLLFITAQHTPWPANMLFFLTALYDLGIIQIRELGSAFEVANSRSSKKGDVSALFSRVNRPAISVWTLIICHSINCTAPVLYRIHEENAVLFVTDINISAFIVASLSCLVHNILFVCLLVGMRILVTLLLDTLPMLGNVLALCFFVFFIFGIVGVQLWAGLLRNRCFMGEDVKM